MTTIDVPTPNGAAAPQAPARVRGRLTGSRGVTVTSLGLVIALGLSVLVAIGLGPAAVPPSEVANFLWAALTGGTVRAEDESAYQIVWQVRTPRVLLAAVVGAGLSAVGVAIQAVVRNALADPYVLGTSAGASVGAVSVSVFGVLEVLGVHAVSGGAFLGAVVASLLVYAVSRSRVGVVPLQLVLTGVALGFGFQALMSVIVYFAPGSEATSAVIFWSMGGFGAATWDALPLVGAVVLAGVVLLGRQSRAMDALALGDETSASLGVAVARTRTYLFAVTAALTGAMVAVSGAIGFVGLVMPHVVRILVGARHIRVLTVAPLLGAVFMVWVDVLSRLLVAPRELPVGVVTALVGVPVFLLLLRRRAYTFGGRST